MKNKNNKSVILKIKDILKKDIFQNDLINLEKSFCKKNILNPYLLKENIKSSIPKSGKKLNKSSEKKPNNDISKFGIIKITNEYNKYSNFNLINYHKIKKENDEFLNLYKSNKNFYSKKVDFDDEEKIMKKSKSENLFKINPLLIIKRKTLDLFYYFKQKQINFKEEKSVNYLKKIQDYLDNNNNVKKNNSDLKENSLEDSLNKNHSKKIKIDNLKELNKKLFLNKKEENKYKNYIKKIKELIDNVDNNYKYLENICNFSSTKKSFFSEKKIFNNSSFFNNSFSVSEKEFFKNKNISKTNIKNIKKTNTNFPVKKIEKSFEKINKNDNNNISQKKVNRKLNRSLSNELKNDSINYNQNNLINRKLNKNRTIFLKKNSKIKNISKEKKLNDLFVKIKKSPLKINKNILKEIKKYFKNNNSFSIDSDYNLLNLYNFSNLIKNKFKKNNINNFIKKIELKFLSPKINNNIKKIRILNNEINNIDLHIY